MKTQYRYFVSFVVTRKREEGPNFGQEKVSVEKELNKYEDILALQEALREILKEPTLLIQGLLPLEAVIE
ncbi:MAG: hypothetical protein WCO18_02600 [bacterium]